jgi:6-phosphogluconolactonase/glucosamine-6-phosphate isomerase/deaminase
VLVYDPASFHDASAKWAARAVEAAIRSHGHCALAIAGGSTSLAVYKRMMLPWLAERIAWNRVTITLYDENGVPGDDPQPEKVDVLLLELSENRHITSLMPKGIRAAERVIVLAAGFQKAHAVARALEGAHAPPELRVPMGLDGAWILDEAAARELQCGRQQNGMHHCYARQWGA